MIEGLIAERADVARAAARFHATLAAGIVDIARRIGERRVALTGGCFQNRRLTELVVDYQVLVTLQEVVRLGEWKVTVEAPTIPVPYAQVVDDPLDQGPRRLRGHPAAPG
jgi:hypothetical protein